MNESETPGRTPSVEKGPSQSGDEVLNEVGGKPFHGWSCECEECRIADEFGLPRSGEIDAVTAGINPNEPHKLLTNGTLFCTVCDRIASDKVHDYPWEMS